MCGAGADAELIDSELRTDRERVVISRPGPVILLDMNVEYG